mmetsp:Transcript_16447/g.50420  ORF Transcript_16447/g.50420 Transcript_16447/m.50420 type:complete len:276 (-) Transcript_16447:514-1341(-)
MSGLTTRRWRVRSLCTAWTYPRPRGMWSCQRAQVTHTWPSSPAGAACSPQAVTDTASSGGPWTRRAGRTTPSTHARVSSRRETCPSPSGRGRSRWWSPASPAGPSTQPHSWATEWSRLETTRTGSSAASRTTRALMRALSLPPWSLLRTQARDMEMHLLTCLTSCSLPPHRSDSPPSPRPSASAWPPRWTVACTSGVARASCRAWRMLRSLASFHLTCAEGRTWLSSPWAARTLSSASRRAASSRQETTPPASSAARLPLGLEAWTWRPRLSRGL